MQTTVACVRAVLRVPVVPSGVGSLRVSVLLNRTRLFLNSKLVCIQKVCVYVQSTDYSSVVERLE